MFEGMIREGIIGVDYHTFVRNVTQPLSVSYQRHPTAPFAYPPTMALLFIPLTEFGYPAFAAISVVCFLAACRTQLSSVALLLVVLSFPMANVISCGQLTALVMSLALFALTTQNRSMAGLALAVAAGLKPQLVAVFPLYLVAKQDWRAIAFATGGFTMIALSSIAAFGINAWVQWFASLNGYRDVLRNGDVLQWVATPIGMAERYGIWVLPVAAFAIVGAILLAARKYRSPIEALAGLSTANLLILPYGLAYDFLGVIPFVALQVTRRKWLAILPFSFIAPPAALVALVANYGIAAMRKRTSILPIHKEKS